MTLEAAYRRVLRRYPRAWRRANGEVVLGTLLDQADAEGRSVPAPGELRDLRRAGRAAYADLILSGPIRDRVAGVSLGAGAGLALVLITGQLWAPWNSQGSPAEPVPDALVWQILIHPGLWLLAALASVLGAVVLCRVLLVASLPASAIALLATDVSFLLRPSLFALVMLGVLALLACIGRAPRAWVPAGAAITVAAFASWAAFLGPFAGTYFPRGGVIDMIASPLPAGILLVVAVVFSVLGRRIDAVGVIAASAPWLVLLIGDALWYSGAATPVVLGVVAVAIPVAMLLVTRRYAAAPVGFGPWLSPSESSDSPTSASRPSSTP
ncbi:MAG TPA: hypothetical protein VNR36_03330 [Pseudolysinimonas sp.]|nr:hypothetical protein [Pseudolysinimonas sp.]